jgi:KipI family sensor histidine kinase inhibitor
MSGQYVTPVVVMKDEDRIVEEPGPAASDKGTPRFLEAGEGGLVVEFGEVIDPDVNRRVVALDRALSAARPPGMVETVPTYRSLLVVFDPLVLARRDLRAVIEDLLAHHDGEAAPSRLWRVPVCYGGEHGVDLADVAALHGLTPEEVVALHSGAEYRVYMIGFNPGFVYLGGLPERLRTSRRPDPRLRIPPRSVSIGGIQAGLCPPFEMPSGWHLIGQTPVRTFDPARAGEPVLFRPGDRIRFHPVGPADYDDLARAADAGHVVAQREDDDG